MYYLLKTEEECLQITRQSLAVSNPFYEKRQLVSPLLLLCRLLILVPALNSDQETVLPKTVHSSAPRSKADARPR